MPAENPEEIKTQDTTKIYNQKTPTPEDKPEQKAETADTVPKEDPEDAVAAQPEQ